MHDETQANKARFLETFEAMRGMVAPAADKAGVSRSIVYVWEKVDKEFKKRMGEIRRQIPKIMEDRLISIGYEGNYKAVTYYLEHHHPKYRKKKRSETIAHIYHHVEGRGGKKNTSSVSLEEQLYEIAKKNKARSEEVDGHP